jgi:hypothetical protein
MFVGFLHTLHCKAGVGMADVIVQLREHAELYRRQASQTSNEIEREALLNKAAGADRLAEKLQELRKRRKRSEATE